MSDLAIPQAAPLALACERCGTEVAPGLLACPGCGRLLHADELRELAAAAERAEAAGELSTAMETWTRALALLPESSAQHRTVGERVGALAEKVGAAPVPRGPVPAWVGKGGMVLGTAGLLLWKFKFVLVFVLSKVKLLALGFTKMGTLVSMFAAVGVYWTLWGWKFALGFVLSIYVHEMGHVAALRRYGVPASAPMFIPGLGAVVRLKQSPPTPGIDARVGLAGPVWGLGAALAAWAAWMATGSPLWKAIAVTGAILNLFNLLPVWQLDGARAFQALNRAQRWMALGAVVAVWLITWQPWLPLIALAAGWQAWRAPAPADKPDWDVLWLFAFLLLVLSYMGIQPVPGARI